MESVILKNTEHDHLFLPWFAWVVNFFYLPLSPFLFIWMNWQDNTVLIENCTLPQGLLVAVCSANKFGISALRVLDSSPWMAFWENSFCSDEIFVCSLQTSGKSAEFHIVVELTTKITLSIIFLIVQNWFQWLVVSRISLSKLLTPWRRCGESKVVLPRTRTSNYQTHSDTTCMTPQLPKTYSSGG